MSDQAPSWPAALAAYPARVRLPVQWGDQDLLGHVNNVVYFRWFESARMEYFRLVDFAGGGNGGVGPILASTSCRYKAPLYHPDTVIAGCRVTVVHADRFVMDMALYSEALGRIAAVGEALIVAYDYDKLQKAPLPAALLSRIEAQRLPAST
jgi:acyl-CoA thioester hydrolase